MMANLIGIGYQGRSEVEVIAELRQAGVRLVVDVRANPYSRGKKSLLNRNRAETALAEHGIRYIWLGEMLGNPVDATGCRSLEGFQKYMKTWRYEQGLQRLCEILEHADGTVALLCFEREDKGCHRHLIMDDIKRRRQLAL
jgi:uncharacterized protein (DUF488 family)